MDNKNNTGTADKDRINVTEVYKLRGWPEKFSVYKEELTAGVKAVGSMAKDAETYLNK